MDDSCWIKYIYKVCIKRLLINILKFNSNKKRIIIYGAGSAGVLLASNLIESKGYIIRCFVDDNKNLWGRYIKGIKNRITLIKYQN